MYDARVDRVLLNILKFISSKYIKFLKLTDAWY